jgi:NitT/TauT family transport system substrate-binding protein
MPIVQSRRRFLTNLAWGGAAGLTGVGAVGFGGRKRSFAAEPPPEITTIRLEKDTVTCIAPQAAEELLRNEGFTDIRLVEDDRVEITNTDMLTRLNEADFARSFAPEYVRAMDQDQPIMVLAGLHSGCFELVAKDSVRSMMDLKGRTVGVSLIGGGDMMLFSMMAGLVGLDPATDIKWIVAETAEPMQWFIDGKVDAFVALPPELQEIRARKIGHVITSTITDRPWSQYFCCLLATSTAFVRKYPVATKRVLRAILKGVDLCASQPARMAQLLVDRGYSTRYDYALQALSEIRYDVWREYDPEDTLRFYALRLQEAGFIKSSPQKLIAEHTDWRFLNELKRELKT